MEECAEVIQATSKMLRFTADHKYEGYELTNFEHFLEEYHQLMALMLMLKSIDKRIDIDNDKIIEKTAKIIKGLEVSSKLNKTA